MYTSPTNPRSHSFIVGASSSHLNKFLLISHQVPDLDDITSHPIFKDLPGFLYGHRTGQEADEISGIQDSGRIPGFPRRLDSHGTLDQVQRARDADIFEEFRDQRPCYETFDRVLISKSERGWRGLRLWSRGFVQCIHSFR